MQKTLILAEKPSQLREYVKALGGFTKKGDYYESDRYIASSAFGHLIEPIVLQVIGINPTFL